MHFLGMGHHPSITIYHSHYRNPGQKKEKNPPITCGCTMYLLYILDFASLETDSGALSKPTTLCDLPCAEIDRSLHRGLHERLSSNRCSGRTFTRFHTTARGKPPLMEAKERAAPRVRWNVEFIEKTASLAGY